MSETASFRNLLFGLLGLQTNLIDQSALVAAFHAWGRDKGRSMGDILVEAGALDPKRKSLIEALVEEHVDRHEGDVEKSLLAVRAPRAVVEAAAGQDPRFGESLARRAAEAETEEDPELTRLHESEQAMGSRPRFRLVRFHDRGGLGEVFLALDQELNREVALKQIQERHADNAVSRSRFVVEAEITGRLEHPGIVPVYGLGKYPDGRPFYAMRFIRGESLKEAVPRQFAPVAEAQDPAARFLVLHKLLRRFVDVCNTIAYAHSRGVLHRDIKPSNVMLGPFGETLVVDWGLAKVIGHPDPIEGPREPTLHPLLAGADQGSTLPGSQVGTPGYMSPEQVEGRTEDLRPTSDVYSLGAMLYFILTGHAPIEGAKIEELLARTCKGDIRPPREWNAAVPLALESICRRALALAPADRYSSARELGEAVETWLSEQPLAAHRAAVTDYESLAASHPDRASYREGLARARAALADALQVLVRDTEAESIRMAVIEDYRALLRSAPTATSYREGLASAFSGLGRVLTALGREEEARVAYRSAFEEYERLVRAAPHALDYRTNLGNLLVSLGRSADDVQQTLKRLAMLDEPAALAPGMVLQNHELERPLGAGGFGSVWLARNLALQREVALKILPRQSDDESVLARFRREARAMARFSHPNTVSIFSVGSTDDFTYIEMEYVRGIDLGQYLRSHGGRAEVTSVARVVTQLCDVLEAAHRNGILHRDIKPSNIMIAADSSPGREIVKLLDFGLASVMGIDPARDAGPLHGTPAYMSPEQVRGDSIDERSDIYALGVVMYEMLTGSRPFQAVGTGLLMEILQAAPPPFRSANPEARVPSDLEAIVMKCLEKAPDRRYGRVAELRADLTRAAQGGTSEAQAVAPLRTRGAAHRLSSWFGIRGSKSRRPQPSAPTPAPRSVDPVPPAAAPRAAAERIQPPASEDRPGGMLASESPTTAKRLDRIRRPRVEISATSPGSSHGASAPAESSDLGERYEFRRRLAEGELGRLWLVHDNALHRDVVLKALGDRNVENSESRRWFLKEAQLTAQLEHPHIVPVYDIGRTLSGRPYYTMKYLRGGSYRGELAHVHAGAGAGNLDWSRLLRSYLDICSAVAFAHARGVLHRDLTPSNVLLDEAATVYVADWGLSKEMGGGPDDPDRLIQTDDALHTRAGTVIGTPAYMSPEQAMGRLDDVGIPSDVYGLGAILFEVLTGRAPFANATVVDVLMQLSRGEIPVPSEVNPRAPRRLERVCTRAMSRTIAERHRSVDELIRDLREALREDEITLI